MNGHQPTPLKEVLIEFTFSKNWGIISNQKISKKPIHPTIIYPHLYQPVQLEASVPIDLSTGEPRKIPPGVSIGKPVNNGRNLQYNINWVALTTWDVYKLGHLHIFTTCYISTGFFSGFLNHQTYS